MKKLLISLVLPCSLLLAGCFDNIREITLREDGSGIVDNTSDMSSLLGIAKQMGGGSDLEKMEGQSVDTIVSLASKADSIPNLSVEEKEMVKKGSVHMNADLKDEKFLATLSFPFSSPAEINPFDQLATKVMAQTMKEQIGGLLKAGGMPDMPEPSSFDDYFTTVYSTNEVERALNKDKYALVSGDEYLKGMQEAGGMGLTLTSTLIIHLPRPAKKAEGKNLKLSEDKKTITVKTDIDDFFDDPSKLEFRVEY